MTEHLESRALPYSTRQMFDLVADVARYPEFLPWTQSARVRGRTQIEGGEEMLADLVVSFKVFRERYTSKVVLTPERGDGSAEVDVDAIDGPFEMLRTNYVFRPDGPNSCTMDLSVNFAFRNKLLQHAAGLAFGHAISRVSKAFEDRAEQIYGAPVS